MRGSDCDDTRTLARIINCHCDYEFEFVIREVMIFSVIKFKFTKSQNSVAPPTVYIRSFEKVKLSRNIIEPQ